jgi:hypothetical protein
MTYPLAIVITCPPEWHPPDELDIADPSQSRGMKAYIKRCGLFARMAATSLGVELQDRFELPLEFRADPLLTGSIHVEFMVSAGFLVTAGAEDLVGWCAENFMQQMQRYVWERPEMTVNVTVTLFDGQNAHTCITPVGR